MQTRSGARGPRAFILALAVWGSASVVHAQAPGRAPPVGAWLRYHYEEVLSDGTGEYEGYAERTTARARYTIEHVDGSSARIGARYAWRYVSPERDERRSIERDATFSLADRRYVDVLTDVSDYDDRDGRELATWIWIPPDAQPGMPLRILEHDEFVVISTTEQVAVAGAMRRAIAVQARYEGVRDDAYGTFDTVIVDRYWFDAATGLFLREVHDERDRGTSSGRAASFRMLTTIEVIDASYAPATTPPSDDEEALGRTVYVPPASRSARDGLGPGCFPIFLVLVLVVGVVVLVLRSGRATRPRRVTGAGLPFRVERVDASMPPLPAGLSAHFDDVLPHLAAVTRASGNAVAIAKLEGQGTIVGLALADAQSGVGSIFARDPDVCEALRESIGQSEFFSELRHARLESVVRSGLQAPPHAYNVYETYDVLELRARPEDLGYDTEVVSPMRDEERTAVASLLSEAYGVPSAPWLAASIAQGDLAWVAHHEGRVVGVAMATLVGTTARLHTLTVHAQHRQRGLGTALYRARLRALFDLGATRVITECATWNLAACELARAHGFEKVGQMFVETSRSERDERRFVRR